MTFVLLISAHICDWHTKISCWKGGRVLVLLMMYHLLVLAERDCECNFSFCNEEGEHHLLGRLINFHFLVSRTICSIW